MGLPQQRFLRRLGNMLPHEKARANASLASTEISKSNAKEFVFLTRCNHSFLKMYVSDALLVQDTIHILYRFFTNYRILNKCTYSSARSRSRSSTLWHGDKSGGNFGLFGMRFLIDRNEHRVELGQLSGSSRDRSRFYAISAPTKLLQDIALHGGCPCRA